MGCHQSIVEDNEMQEKFKERKSKFEQNRENYHLLQNSNKQLFEKAKKVTNIAELESLIYDEGRNIYDNNISKGAGAQAIYLLITKELLIKKIIRDVNLHDIIHKTIYIGETYLENDDIEEVDMLINNLHLPTNTDIVLYSAMNYKEFLQQHVIDNLKYETIFYLENIFLHLIKSDIQNSQRMIDLGEIIDINPNIKNLLVYIEPILVDEYNHKKSKQKIYKANCSNLSYFFDAIRKSISMENLCIISDQKVQMKLTNEVLEKFFSIFDNENCNIKSLVLINFDIKEKDIIKFNNLFKNAKNLKYFIFQPPWPNDVYLDKISEAVKFSKTLELFVFFHGKKCSEDELDKAIININKSCIKKAFFEDNFYYLRNIKENKKIPNSINFVFN